MLSGPQIDPTFCGILTVRVINLAPKPIALPYEAPFLTIQFFRLSSPVSKRYCGTRQGQGGISSKDIQELVETEGLTLGQVMKTLGALARDVSELKGSISRLAWSIPLIVGVGMAVIGADAAAVAQLTVAMASAIATSGRSVLAVDTDTGEARCATLLRRPVEPGLTDALARGVAWDDVVQRHIGSYAAPLDVVPPGRSLPFAPGTVAVDAAATALGRLADGYDLTLVTVTPADTPIAEALLAPARVREALMVVELGETVLAGMRRTRERLAARGVTIVGVVVYVAG